MSHFESTEQGGNLSPEGLAKMRRVILIGKWERRRALYKKLTHRPIVDNNRVHECSRGLIRTL